MLLLLMFNFKINIGFIELIFSPHLLAPSLKLEADRDRERRAKRQEAKRAVK